MVERLAYTEEVAGSNPAPPTEGGARAEQIHRLARLLLPPLLVLALLPPLLIGLGVFPIDSVFGGFVPDVYFFGHFARVLLQSGSVYAHPMLLSGHREVPFIYPPLTLLVALPGLLAGSRYLLGFSLSMVVMLALGLWALHRAGRQLALPQSVTLLTLVLLLAVGPLLVTRVDALQGLALAGAALALRARRLSTAVLLVSLAVLVKETVVPALLPVLFCALWPGGQWTAGARLRDRLRAIAWGLLPAALVVAGFGVWSGGRLFTAALSSVQRGVEVESVAATLAYLGRPLAGLSAHTGHLGSVEVSGPLVGTIAAVLTLLGAVALIWGALQFCRRPDRPATALAFAMGVALVATPVLSPQYLLTLVPVLVLAVMTECPARWRPAMLGLTLAACLLTQFEFPWAFQLVARLEAPGMALVVLRNLVLLALVVALGSRLWGSRSQARRESLALPRLAEPA